MMCFLFLTTHGEGLLASTVTVHRHEAQPRGTDMKILHNAGLTAAHESPTRYSQFLTAKFGSSIAGIVAAPQRSVHAGITPHAGRPLQQGGMLPWTLLSGLGL